MRRGRFQRRCVMGVGVCAVLAAWPALAGDVVHLKDGRVLEGRIVREMTPGGIFLEVDAGTLFVPPDDIDHIEREPVALEDALAALDSDLYADRQRATQALAGDPTLSDDEIALLMGRGDLTPEQSWRLLGVLRARFISTPRGAMGISYNPIDPRTGRPPQIMSVMKEFPAGRAELLKAGDEILTIEGRELAGQIEVMKQETFSRDPGDIMHVRIRRTEYEDGRDPVEHGVNPTRPFPEAGTPGTVTRELDLELKLGSSADFADQRALAEPGVMDLAFATRMARLGVSTPSVRTLETTIDEGEWSQGPMEGARPIDRWNRVFTGPVESGLEGSTKYGRAMVAQPNARLLRQLNGVRQGGNAANIPDALNVRVHAGNLPGGGRAERVLVPEELKAQDAARWVRVQEARRAALQQQRLAVPVEIAESSEAPTRNGADPLGEANRLATRIGALEGRIAEQTRVLRSTAAEDPTVRRMAEDLIGELRAQITVLRAQLLDTMSGRTARGAEAALDGE